MAWKCSQCGEDNENMSDIKCTCGHEMTQEEQSKSKADFLRSAQGTYAILKASILIFVLSPVFMFILPNNEFLNYYVWIAVQCLIIYGLNKIYPLKTLLINKKSLRLGLVVGIFLFGAKLLIYIRGNSITPANYIAFVNYAVLWKSLFIIETIVLAPVVEEILFRGYFYHILKDRYNIFWGGLISILLFAAVHDFDGSGFLFGLIFTYVYEKSETVWGSMLAHSLNNLGYVYFHYMV